MMQSAYDPNCEATNSERVVAGHWECLRRNKEFRTLSERWLRSEEFRFAHVLSPEYHDMEHHTPRCAWDWMLTPAQRHHLANFQIDKCRLVPDSDFNFGPIICREKFYRCTLTKNNWPDFLQVEPLQKAPTPLTIDQAWDSAPELFKKQFRLARVGSKVEFGEISPRLDKLSKDLRNAASKLANGDPFKEAPTIALRLSKFSDELMELAESSKIFNIPKSRYSEKQFNSLLAQVRESFKASNLLVPTKTYDTHESYLGTKEDWRWFLEAERLHLDIRKSADLATLAERYSEYLRQRAIRGKGPRRAKAHGFASTKFSGKVIKNRRRTVKRHVLCIEKWIHAAYPPGTREPGATAT